ncbi:hypothetical protein [Streptomyces sp. NPDC091212]|uniref:hypothetical protein n=1 Tax=Streptomyces sp. NPDC091212 TaxID=3155191 RepID=UPI0034323C0B
MSTDDTARIVVGDADALVFSPFEALGRIKTTPKRHRAWGTDRKCWVIALALLLDLTAVLVAAARRR